MCDLSTASQPGPGGSPHFERGITAEVPQNVDKNAIDSALKNGAGRLVVDIWLEHG